MGNILHAGDGNPHPLVLYNLRDADEVRRAHQIATAVMHLRRAQGSMISGAHGMGLEKAGLYVCPVCASAGT